MWYCYLNYSFIHSSPVDPITFHPESSVAFCCHSSLVPNLEQFLNLSLSLMTLTFLKA